MRGAVGERVRRVAALDDHRPEAVGVVGEDLVGDRRWPGISPVMIRRAGDRACVVGPCATAAAEARRCAVWMFMPPALPKLPVSR